MISDYLRVALVIPYTIFMLFTGYMICYGVHQHGITHEVTYDTYCDEPEVFRFRITTCLPQGWHVCPNVKE